MRILLLLLLIFSGFASAQSRQVVSDAGEKFIARWEVGGPELYTRKYQVPIWPGNSASGVTIGIGYDLGHNSTERILDDWREHEHRGYLAAMSGFKGQSAGNLAKRRAWIKTPLPLAMKVFRDPTLIRYYNIARRSFPGLQDQDQAVIDMIVDLVYNRGGNMIGKDREEMRYIANVCFPARDHACTANQIRKMSRIWAGRPLGKGLIARRNQEADFIMIRARRA